jgi:hypothetical protein
LVTYFEVDITIEYSRTSEELEAITAVVTEQELTDLLLYAMSRHSEEVVLLGALQLTEEMIVEKIRQIYYNNPSKIVMLPIATVEMFPETGSERVYSIQFSFMYAAAMMGRFSEWLTLYVEQNAGRIEGDTDSLRLLALVRNLAASIEFMEGTATTISVHGAQNWDTTAYGALVRGRAVGEGFAMAFKALSIELGFDTHIVLGYLDERIHAWNIVRLEGYYYHIDVAMISKYGLEAAFLKNDYEFEEMGYVWDMENTVICDGPLSLADVLALEEPDYDEEPGYVAAGGGGYAADGERDDAEYDVQDEPYETGEGDYNYIDEDQDYFPQYEHPYEEGQ